MTQALLDFHKYMLKGKILGKEKHKGKWKWNILLEFWCLFSLRRKLIKPPSSSTAKSPACLNLCPQPHFPSMILEELSLLLKNEKTNEVSQFSSPSHPMSLTQTLLSSNYQLFCVTPTESLLLAYKHSLLSSSFRNDLPSAVSSCTLPSFSVPVKLPRIVSSFLVFSSIHSN